MEITNVLWYMTLASFLVVIFMMLIQNASFKKDGPPTWFSSLGGVMVIFTLLSLFAAIAAGLSL